MVDAMFERNGMRVHPGPLCTGPWDPNSMHGGPPTVLAGRYLAEHGAGDAFHLARLTVELVRPVPLVPLTVDIRETRPGRRIQLLDLVLRDEQDTELVYARGMRIARGDNGLDESLLDMPGPVAVAGPDDSIPYEHGYPLPAGGFYMDAFDIRSSMADRSALLARLQHGSDSLLRSSPVSRSPRSIGCSPWPTSAMASATSSRWDDISISTPT